MTTPFTDDELWTLARGAVLAEATDPNARRAFFVALRATYLARILGNNRPPVETPRKRRRRVGPTMVEEICRMLRESPCPLSPKTVWERLPHRSRASVMSTLSTLTRRNPHVARAGGCYRWVCEAATTSALH